MYVSKLITVSQLGCFKTFETYNKNIVLVLYTLIDLNGRVVTGGGRGWEGWGVGGSGGEVGGGRIREWVF